PTGREVSAMTYFKEIRAKRRGRQVLPSACYWAYSVEEVGSGAIGTRLRIADEHVRLLHQAGARLCSGIILAILRRFWAAAARWNSSFAPLGPRRRKRSSLRMRLR